MFCKHKWNVIQDVTTESKAKHALNIGLCFKDGPGDLLDRKNILVLTCEKCGKLKRFVENI